MASPALEGRGGGMRWSDVKSGAWMGLSAAAYLVAFGSNLAAGVEYYRLARTNPSQYLWIPITYAVMLLVSHTCTPLIFRFQLREPLSTAFFFPLLQLRRLARLLLTTLSLRGLKELESPEMSSLFGLMAAAVETAPHLQIQLIVILLKFHEGKGFKVVWLSLAASLFSAMLNNVMAISSVSTHQSWNLRHKTSTVITAGLFTLSVLILGCLSFIGLSMWKRLPVRIGFLVVPPVILCFMYLALWKEEDISEMTFSKVFRMFILGYVSLTVGPIYPLAYYAKNRNEHGTSAHCYRLLLIGSFQMAFYISVFVICFCGPVSWRWFSRCGEVFQAGPTDVPCFFFVPTTAIAVGVYVLSMTCYILLLDQSSNDNLPSELESLSMETSQGSADPLYPGRNVVIDQMYNQDAAQMRDYPKGGFLEPGFIASLSRSIGSGPRLPMRSRSTAKFWVSHGTQNQQRLKWMHRSSSVT